MAFSQHIPAIMFINALSVSVLLMANAGCSGGDSLVVVKGNVTVNDSPANGALVLFHHDGNSAAVTASGVVKEDGVFTLSSGLETGVAPGNYTVTITWPDPTVETTPQQMMQGMIADAPDLLDGAYATKATSTLKAEITASTTVIPPFNLKTQ